MRRARLKVSADQAAGYYHCLSRVVDRRFILEEAEKEHFVALMRECEAFCEVRVLTHCVMSTKGSVRRRGEGVGPGIDEFFGNEISLDRVTNMVDAAATTTYTYTSAGNLLTEETAPGRATP